MDHAGEDWNGDGGGNTDCGETVYSVSNGTVLVAQDFGLKTWGRWGNVVIVRHVLPEGEQVESLYGHLDNVFVRPGTPVQRRTPIGTIGNAHPPCNPFSTVVDSKSEYFSHLHFEIRDSANPYWGAFPGCGVISACGNSTPVPGYRRPSDFIMAHRPGPDTGGIGGNIPPSGTLQTTSIAKVIVSTATKIDKTAVGAETKITALVAKARKRFDKMVSKDASDADIQEAVQQSLDSIATLILKTDVGLDKAVDAARAKLEKLKLKNEKAKAKNPTLTQEAEASLYEIQVHADEASLKLIDLHDQIEEQLNEAYP